MPTSGDHLVLMLSDHDARQRHCQIACNIFVSNYISHYAFQLYLLLTASAVHEELRELYLASPWAPICCRIPPSANNTPMVRIVCSWYRPREAWSTEPSCRRGYQTGRNCCPRDRKPTADRMGPRTTQLRDCRPAVESDANQTNNTAFTSCWLNVERPINIRSRQDSDGWCRMKVIVRVKIVNWTFIGRET